MTSPRKICANRANARVSTGPRSASGKSRASQNARQHGLSLTALKNTEHAAAVKVWALRILDGRKTPELYRLALQIAAAQVDLSRVRQARYLALSHALGKRSDFPTEQEYWAAVADAALRSSVLDRYERRALSRRKFAIRAFDAAGRAQSSRTD